MQLAGALLHPCTVQMGRDALRYWDAILYGCWEDGRQHLPAGLVGDGVWNVRVPERLAELGAADQLVVAGPWRYEHCSWTACYQGAHRTAMLAVHDKLRIAAAVRGGRGGQCTRCRREDTL
jgi:hypothetical protein